jgi:SAM-dependent methyltransferase
MAKTTLVDWYDTPRWYDLVFEPGTRREGSFLLAMSRRHGRGEARRVLEPACGSGRLVVDLARRGLEVEGFDLNERMLDAARAKLARRGLRADLRAGDMARVPSGPAVDLAHCLVSTFKYLLDERSARAHLAGVARRLAPGGVYVLGLHLTDYRRRGSQVERWVVERDSRWPRADASTRRRPTGPSAPTACAKCWTWCARGQNWNWWRPTTSITTRRRPGPSTMDATTSCWC